VNKIVNLEDASLSEVLARVTYRLVELQYLSNVGRYADNRKLFGDVMALLGELPSSVALRAFVLSASLSSAKGTRVKAWRNEVIRRSRSTPSRCFRSHLLPSYKAGRLPPC